MKVKIGDKIFDSLPDAIDFIEALCKMHEIDCPEIEGENDIDKLYRFCSLLDISLEKVSFLQENSETV